MGYRQRCVEHSEIIRPGVYQQVSPGPGSADVQKASMVSDQPHGSPSTGSRGHVQSRALLYESMRARAAMMRQLGLC